MKVLLTPVRWMLLLAVCWPLALVAMIVWAVLGLPSIPLRNVGLAVGAVPALAKAIFCPLGCWDEA